jgi:hypothetical protein
MRRITIIHSRPFYLAYVKFIRDTKLELDSEVMKFTETRPILEDLEPHFALIRPRRSQQTIPPVAHYVTWLQEMARTRTTDYRPAIDNTLPQQH